MNKEMANLNIDIARKGRQKIILSNAKYGALEAYKERGRRISEISRIIAMYEKQQEMQKPIVESS